MTAAIAGRGYGTLQSQHQPPSALDVPMALLQAVIGVATRPMPHLPAEFGSDGSRLAIMAIRGDPRLHLAPECCTVATSVGPCGLELLGEAIERVHPAAEDVGAPVAHHLTHNPT